VLGSKKNTREISLRVEFVLKTDSGYPKDIFILSFFLDGADGDFSVNFFFVFLCKVFVANLSLIILDFSVQAEFLLKTNLSFDNHQITNRVFIEN